MEKLGIVKLKSITNLDNLDKVIHKNSIRHIIHVDDFYIIEKVGTLHKKDVPEGMFFKIEIHFNSEEFIDIITDDWKKIIDNNLLSKEVLVNKFGNTAILKDFYKPVLNKIVTKTRWISLKVVVKDNLYEFVKVTDLLHESYNDAIEWAYKTDPLSVWEIKEIICF